MIEEQKFPEFAKPIMVGHSMGSKAVMALALRRPDLPKFVCAVDTAPIAFGNSDSQFGKYVNQLRLAVEKYKYTNMKDVDAKLAEVEPSEVVRQFLMTNLNRGKDMNILLLRFLWILLVMPLIKELFGVGHMI